jgi:hypothetical protein
MTKKMLWLMGMTMYALALVDQADGMETSSSHELLRVIDIDASRPGAIGKVIVTPESVRGDCFSGITMEQIQALLDVGGDVVLSGTVKDGENWKETLKHGGDGGDYTVLRVQGLTVESFLKLVSSSHGVFVPNLAKNDTGIQKHSKGGIFGLGLEDVPWSTSRKDPNSLTFMLVLELLLKGLYDEACRRAVSKKKELESQGFVSCGDEKTGFISDQAVSLAAIEALHKTLWSGSDMKGNWSVSWYTWFLNNAVKGSCGDEAATVTLGEALLNIFGGNESSLKKAGAGLPIVKAWLELRKKGSMYCSTNCLEGLE